MFPLFIKFDQFYVLNIENRGVKYRYFLVKYRYFL